MVQKLGAEKIKSVFANDDEDESKGYERDLVVSEPIYVDA